MDKAQDKKKLPSQASKTKTGPMADNAGVAREKDDLGAMLRPDNTQGGKEKDGKGVRIGKTTDSAEKEADQVAEKIVNPTQRTVKDDETAQTDATRRRTPWIRGPPIRAGPQDSPIIRRVADQNGDQPNTDDLVSVPALDQNLTDVNLPGTEEAVFEDMSAHDFDVLSEGQLSVMMKALPEGGHPDHLSGSLARFVTNPAGGAYLPATIAARIGGCLGRDLSDIRVHCDSTAQMLATHIHARAFACGRHVFLKNPADIGNLRLMAHEIAHCVQQGATRVLSRPSSVQVLQPPIRAPPGAGMIRRFDENGDDGLLARGAERLADNLDSYQLLKVLIGRRLFTGQTVQQTPAAYVGAFMGFIGADESFEQMKQSGSLERGFQTIRDGAERYDLNWARVRNIFSRAYDTFEWTSPIDSFRRIFGPFFRDLLNFGVLIMKVVAELIAEAFVVGFGSYGRAVWEKIKTIGENIGLILENPLGFAMNLIRAVARGIQRFGSNIVTHIKKGLLAWVLGPLAAMGVQLPEKLDLKGIVNVLLQVLGLTYPQLRPRIIRALNPRGEIKVTLVERLIEIINILRTEGLAGIWRKFLDYVENLQMTVINGIRDWVVRAVIQAGIRKLVAWSNPVGALLDILFTIYKLVSFFVEKLEQILSFANSVFESIGRVARGQLTEAAEYIENTLSLTIPIMISFLTSLLGLPDITGAVRRIITNLRARVHAAVDRVLDFIVTKVKKLIARLIARFKSSRGEPEGSVNMQGTTHRLAFEEVGHERRLFMHSDDAQVCKAQMDDNMRGMDNCVAPLTSVTKTEANRVGERLAEQERHEASEAGKPESNRSSPDNNARRDECLQMVSAGLERATDPSIRVTQAVASGAEDVDDQPPQAEVEDGEQIPEDQKNTVEVDMEDIHFRYVIVPEGTNLEASWGRWSDMQTKRDGFKAKLEEMKLEGRYAVDLDHNPEYQILWRLGHLEYRQDQREDGPEKTPEGRIYPEISNYYGNSPLASGNRRTRASSDSDFVMAIRYDAHRGLPNTQTANVQTFNSLCEYSASQQAFVPKRDKDTELIGVNWADLIRPQAQTHQAEVENAYDRMFQASFVSDGTLANIRSNGATMIANGLQIISGQPPSMPNGGEAAGYLGGIGMRRDPVNAELVTGDYSAIGAQIQSLAPRFGRVFDKHHLIEKSILAVVQSRFNNVRLLPSVMDAQTPVAGLVLSGTPLTDVADTALQDAVAQNPALAGAGIAAERARLLSMRGIRGVGACKTDDTESKGFAISVLKVVNGLLGSQPETNVNNAISTHLQALANSRAETMRQAVRDGYSGVDVAADATPQDAAAALSAKTTRIRASLVDATHNGFYQDLRDALPEVLDQLTGNAHLTFSTAYQASLDQMRPRDKNFPAGSEAQEVYANLQDRFSRVANNLSVVQQENRRRWVA